LKKDSKEYEVRFIDINEKKIKKILKLLGAKLINKKRLMPLTVFHHPTNKENTYIRIRDEGDKITLTSKENMHFNTIPGKYPEEYEVIIDNIDEGVLILTSLGCVKKYSVEKIRETYSLPGVKEIVFDSYPGLPTYMEIDCHTEKNLNRLVALLGLDIKDQYNGTVVDQYYYHYEIPLDRDTNTDLTFKNGLKIFEKLIGKNKSLFKKTLKRQLKVKK
jgi:adenylate cyclase class 2